MNCHDTQKLLQAYADGELDLTATLTIEEHLQECAACRRLQADMQGLRSALQGNSMYFEPPPELHNRIQTAVRGAGRVKRPPCPFPWRGLAIAASLAFVLLAGWEMVRFVTARPADDSLTRELVASHVHSQLLASHRVDFESSNQHKVKPWFEGKLDFSPPVYDLTEHGFDLLGGRLDYVNGRPVAALVYGRRQHHIDLYVWPSPGVESTTTTATRQGYHLVHWAQAGMTYWAVSDLNESELQEFVRLLQDKGS